MSEHKTLAFSALLIALMLFASTVYAESEFETTKRAAEQGDAVAQFNLGLMYAKGEGAPQDHSEAARWFFLAAKQGHAEAQFNLSCSPRRFEIIKRAAEQGDVGAQVYLGYMYSEGKGVSQDHAEAVRWYRLAAEQGHAGAQYVLGDWYYYGGGVVVPQDYTEAARWYRLAAEQGDAGVQQYYAAAVPWYRLAGAQYTLGIMYSEGKGVPQDHAEAVRWYRLAAEQSYAEAQGNLANKYAKGEGVPQDYVQAYAWYRVAAANTPRHWLCESNKESMENLAKDMTQNQIAEAQKLSREYWKTYVSPEWWTTYDGRC